MRLAQLTRAAFFCPDHCYEPWHISCYDPKRGRKYSCTIECIGPDGMVFSYRVNAENQIPDLPRLEHADTRIDFLRHAYWDSYVPSPSEIRF